MRYRRRGPELSPLISGLLQPPQSTNLDSMDFLQPHNFLFALCFFLILFSSSLFSTTADEYFINCGSSSTVAINDGRNFAGDIANPAAPCVEILATGNSVVKNTGNKPELYQTAMVFSSPAAYRFNVIENGTYILRLHFSASLANSRFNVSASGIMLLTDFRSNRDSVAIEEFLLTVDPGEFNVYFVPCSSSTVAFVNAIELFLTPLNTFTGSPVVVSTGIDSNLISRVLHPIYRINFGGQIVPSSNDRLWRTWFTDDPYLQSKITAKNGPIRISRPNYQAGNATDYDAPDAVYNTAKELNEDLIRSENFFNATWSFNVSRSSTYLVRVHLCDMISKALGATVFNLYVASDFVRKIDPYAAAPYLAAPFYLDFLVGSDELGFVNISIAPRNDTRISENAFINGLEIMEVLSNEVVEPRFCDPGLSKKGIVALVACVVALSYLLITCLCSGLNLKNALVIKAKPVESLSYWPLVNLDGGGNSESKLTS